MQEVQLELTGHVIGSRRPYVHQYQTASQHDMRTSSVPLIKTMRTGITVLTAEPSLSVFG